MSRNPNQRYWHRKRILAWLLIVGTTLCTLAFKFLRTAAQINPADVQRATVPPSSDGTHPCVFWNVSEPSSHPELGRCGTPLDHSAALDRTEVDLRYGAFVIRQSDIFLQDVFAVPLTRSYFSADWIDVNRPHSFGRNTSHPYDLEPLGSRSPYTYLNLVFEDGLPLYFGRISSGTSFTDAVYMHTDTSTRFYKATISWNGDGWTLRLTDGTTTFFPEAYNSATVAQGAISRLMDGQGNELILNRDQARHLSEIKTPHGRRIHFTYDAKDRIMQLNGDQGPQVAYTYSDPGMLTDVVSSSGLQRHYAYDGTQMTTISDEHGRILLHNAYDLGLLVRQDYANGDVFHYHYQYIKGATQVQSVIITLPNATTKTINMPEPLRHE